MPRPQPRATHLLCGLVLLWSGPGGVSSVRAHELELTEVHARFASDGSFRVDVMNDPGWLLARVEPFSGLPLSGRLDPPDRDRRLVDLEGTFAEWVHLRFDGVRVDVEATYLAPTVSGPTAVDGTPLGVMRLEGRVPAGAGTFRFAYGLIMDPYPLYLADRQGAVLTYWNVGEAETEPFTLDLLVPPSPWRLAAWLAPSALGVLGVLAVAWRWRRAHAAA